MQCEGDSVKVDQAQRKELLQNQEGENVKVGQVVKGRNYCRIRVK